MRMLVLFPRLFAKRYWCSKTVACTSSKYASTTHRTREQWFLVATIPLIIGVIVICARFIHAQENTSARFIPVKIYVPAFDSPKGKPLVGRKTGVILALQIWRTYSTDIGMRSEFDNADIIYNSESAPTNIK